MSQHLTQNQIEQYGRRLLSATELLSVCDHLGVCETCRRQAERAIGGDAAFFALKTEAFGEAATAFPPPARQMHLNDEQTAGYVDEDLPDDELQAIKDHLALCVQCGRSVNDVRAFKNQVSSELNREQQPSAARVATGSGWRRLIPAGPFLFPRSRAMNLGTAVVTIFLILLGWQIWRARERPGNKPDIVNQEPSPTASVTTAAVSPTPMPAGETLIARLNDGGTAVGLDREGKLSGLENLPPAYRQMIRAALTDQQLTKSPFLAGLTRPGNSGIRGDEEQDNKFSVIEPVGRVLLSDRPTFRWSRLDGAADYVVEIHDDKFTLVVASPRLTGASWTASQNLPRGKIYTWQVKAAKDGQELITPRAPAPQAKFRILDEAKTNELTQAQRAYASSHLAMGILYAQSGLIKEAERELRALQNANPNSAVARRLLASVQMMRR